MQIIVNIREYCVLSGSTRTSINRKRGQMFGLSFSLDSIAIKCFDIYKSTLKPVSISRSLFSDLSTRLRFRFPVYLVQVTKSNSYNNKTALNNNRTIQFESDRSSGTLSSSRYRK